MSAVRRQKPDLKETAEKLRRSLSAETQNQLAGNSPLADDIDLVIRGLASQREQQILEALRRIENGTYGVCEDCGEPIGAERLAVLPEALLCVDCQKQKERHLELLMNLRDTYFPDHQT